jgi:hypothetical protein
MSITDILVCIIILMILGAKAMPIVILIMSVVFTVLAIK